MFGLNEILTHSLAYAIGEDEGRIKAKKEDNNTWHTGEPTEDGEYVCTVIVDLADGQDRPIKLKANYLFSFKDGIAENDILGEPHKIIRYFKVPPYKED